MTAELVVAGTYSNIMQAEVARSKLEAAGIDAIVTKDDAGGMIPSFQVFAGVQVMVRADDLPSAKEILTEEPPLETEDECPNEEA